MNPLQDRRVLMAGGCAAALLAGVLIAVFLTAHGRTPEAENATSPGELQVQQVEQPKLDPDRQLRCFVGGQFIGAATLADCAKKNGVSAQALDVGLDESGALAAGGDSLKPLPQVAPPVQVAIAQPPPPPVAVQPPPTLGPTPAGAPIGECLRYGGEGWSPTGGGLTLSACVQTLFAGRCERPGEALYGRWAGQTLRLVPGRVEASGDNHDFHGLADQGRDCSIPPL
jgi:hypothetical protein